MTLRIASRDQFFQALTDVRAEVQAVGAGEPANPAWAYVARLLDTMAGQTDQGREPPLQERRDNVLGAFVDRELEPPASDEMAALNQRLQALFLYFIVWPADGVDPEEMPEDEFLARI